MGLRVYVEWLVREEEVGCELMHTCDEGVAVMAKSTVQYMSAALGVLADWRLCASHPPLPFSTQCARATTEA